MPRIPTPSVGPIARTLPVLAALLWCSSPRTAAGETELRIAPGPYYVGQAIELRLAVPQGDGSAAPRVVPPVAPPGVDLVRLGASSTESPEPGGVTARFRLVPRRAGELVIPPFRIEGGPSTERTRPARLRVAAPPSSGRPREFLGGVGEFRLAAEVSPPSVRAGEPCEYRIRVAGPAAVSTAGTPGLGRIGRVPLGLQVRSLPAEATADPPAIVFRWRLRPTRAGRAVLPPVAVAAFDPKSGRYATRATPGVPLLVRDVPRFDPGSGLEPAASSARLHGAATAAIAVLAVVGLLASAAVAARLRRGRRLADPRSEAARWAAGLPGTLDPGDRAAEAARRIADGLAEYLRRASGRPPGALTPDEAREAVGRVAGSDGLAQRARRLIALCDRARYSSSPPPADELVFEARAFFGELGQGGGGRGGRGEPREAAGIGSKCAG